MNVYVPILRIFVHSWVKSSPGTDWRTDRLRRLALQSGREVAWSLVRLPWMCHWRGDLINNAWSRISKWLIIASGRRRWRRRRALNIHSDVCRRCLSSSHPRWRVSRNLRTQSSWHVDFVRSRHAFSVPVSSHTFDISLVNLLSIFRSHAGDLEPHLSAIIHSPLHGSQQLNAEISNSICYYPRMRRGKVFGRICLSVCLSVCL